jgi:aldehyde:ferredoxin oxidoreductase
MDVQCALLDAAYASLRSTPAVERIIEGSTGTKAALRAEIVCAEVFRLAPKTPARTPRVLLVGTVGAFVHELTRRGMDVACTDLDPDLIGQRLRGVEVEAGERNFTMLETADVLLVTGMTLGTPEFDRLLASARSQGTPTVLFAESGANFGHALCEYGVDCVVSEPFPFYIFAGKSVIRVFRRVSQ